MLKSIVHDTMNPHPLNIVFFYNTEVGDLGWSYAHNLGKQAVQSLYRDRVNVQSFVIADSKRAEITAVKF